LVGGEEPVWEEWTQEAILDISRAFTEEWVHERGVVEPIPLDTYLKKFSGSKKERLAASINRAFYLGKWDSNVTGFVKCDKYDAATVETKPPRMIQFVSPAVNAELARFMEPVEHHYLLGPGHGPTKLPSCTKGMNMTQRADVWVKKRAAFRNPVCLLGDFSKFDSHVHTHVLTLEHDWWHKASGCPRGLLDAQLFNNCTAGNIHWRAVGTRMSGHRNTGGGNSFINIMITQTVARAAGVEIELMCDGDDSLVFMELEDLDRYTDAASNIIPRVYGMKWGFDVAYSPDEEEYCHTRQSYDECGIPTCVIDPVRAITRAAAVVNRCGGRVLGSQLVATLVGLYCSYPNHPVISPFSWNLLGRLGALDESGTLTAHTLAPEDVYHREKWEACVRPWQVGEKIVLPRSYLIPGDLARNDVASSFGISVEDQLRLEQTLWKEVELNPTLKFRAWRGPEITRERETLALTNDWSVPALV
jgi:hypothetical protein